MYHITVIESEDHPKGAISVLDKDGRVIAIIKGFDIDLETRFRERNRVTPAEIIEAGNPMTPDLGAPIGWFNKKEHRKMGG